MHTWNCENAFVRLAVTVVIYFFTIFSLPVPLYLCTLWLQSTIQVYKTYHTPCSDQIHLSLQPEFKFGCSIVLQCRNGRTNALKKDNIHFLIRNKFGIPTLMLLWH
jgi:hypothetical protein